MANRHLARSVVLQSLFELDADAKHASPQDIFLANVHEFAPDQSIFPFMQQLFDLVRSKQKEIDLIITKAAPEWPLEKIAVVDRSFIKTNFMNHNPAQIPVACVIIELGHGHRQTKPFYIHDSGYTVIQWIENICHPDIV